MHPEAMQAVESMVAASDWTNHLCYALDIGGQAVNGSARPLFGDSVRWESLDLYDPTATFTEDARMFGRRELWDLVLMTEVLEHVRWWPLVVRTAYDAARYGGYIFITAAAPPRHPHSAQGLPEKPADEWYENVNPDELRAFIDEVLKPKRVQHTWRENPGDVYAWMQK